MEQLAAFEDAGRVTRSRAAPVFPDATEPAALYLAIAYTTLAPAIVAPDQVLDRLLHLGWFRSVRLRVSPFSGVGWLDCCGVAWMDLAQVKRHVSQDQGERFVREAIAAQLKKP